MALFLKEVLIAVGVGLGLVTCMALISFLMDPNNLEGRLMIGIGLAAGSFSVSESLGGSGPIAVVTAGITTMWILKNAQGIRPMPGVLNIWRLIEHCLASMFFLLIGIEVLTVDWRIAFILLGVGAWATVFFARVLTVIIGYVGMAVIMKVGSAFYFIMPVSLAGVRGALSVALALSLPVTLGNSDDNRELILAMTFGAVVIGILLQSCGLMAASGAMNTHRSDRVRLRKPLRSVLVSAREKRHRRQKSD